MLEILRWLLGWSEFKIEGNTNLFLGRFKKNIWMVKKKDGVIFARCMTKNFPSFKEGSKEIGCVLTKVKDYGLLNFLKRYKFRFGLVIGIIVFFIVMIVSSFFVWDIEVFGNALVTDEQIFKICDNNGLHFGANIFSINEQNIEHKIKEAFPQISWVSLNRIAGKYLIEISECKQKPDIFEFDEPCNVISTDDGEILYVEAYGGTPLVDVGDRVKKGQILVTGVQEMKGMDNLIYSPSDAKIIAKVNRTHQIKIKKNSIIDQKTGIQKTEKKLSIFGFKIPIKLNKKEDNVVKTKEIYRPLEFLGLRFPILMQTSIYDVYEKVKLKGDLVNTKRIILKQQKDWEIKELMGDKILNREYFFEEDDGDDGFIILNANLVVEQRIDKKASITAEEIKEREEEKKKEDLFT